MAVKSKKKKMVSVVDIGCSNCKFPTWTSFFNRFLQKAPPLLLYLRPRPLPPPPLPPSLPPPTFLHNSLVLRQRLFLLRRHTLRARVAVEKDSDDPYLDFRQSMLQMILENGDLLQDDLRELSQLLPLTQRALPHSIIIRAFSEYGKEFSLPPSNAVAASKSLRSSVIMDRHGPHVITIITITTDRCNV
ncbi:hypothetical protein HID58_095953 [Brassica napus]|uniref:Transcription repressor n=1 Tax=Brassica napus TaxID=3708 RepID=A0ABQ7X1Y3_BRANA|nr:hypothetical protein HID58_095953 [Brassica napus]